jgi:hypothetical protein
MLSLRNFIVIGFCTILFTASSFGQGGYGSTFAGDIAIPIGSFSKSFKTGYGGHVDFYWENESYLRLSVFGGYTRWQVDNEAVNQQYAAMGGKGTYDLEGGISVFPLLLGVKLLSPEKSTRFYGLLEVGVYLYSGKLTGQKTENGVVTQSVYEDISKSVPGANLGAGLLFAVNKELSIDVAGRYHFVKTNTYYTYDQYGTPNAVTTNQYFSFALGVTYNYSSPAGK